MKPWVYPMCIAGFVLFSLAPTFYELSRMGDLNPADAKAMAGRPERQFELVHNFPTDYNFYLSRIRQGLEGRWTATERYTSEPHAGSFIHEMYLLMGQAGRMVRVPLHRAGDVYHVARVVLGVVLLAAVAAFCRGTMGARGAWGVTAFLLAVSASSFPKLVEVNGAWRFGGYMAWWSVMDSLQRITFIPHILAGQILIIFLIRSLTSLKVLRSEQILMLGILAFLLGMVFPPGLVFVIGAIGVLWIIGGRKTSEILPYGAVFLMGSASLFYLGLMTSFYPWKRLVEVDIIRPLPFEYVEYFKSVGILGVIGAIGGIWALWKKERRMYPAVAWVIAWIGFLAVFRFVPQQSPLRFSEMVPHVPLAVLSAYLLSHLSDLRYLRNLGKLTAITLVGLGLFHMYSSYLWQKDFVDHKIRATLPLVPTGSFVMYPLKDFINAMWYIYDATKGDGIIMSETTAGNYLPVISGLTAYAGHDNTVAFEEKKILVQQFFSGKSDGNWLKDTQAAYVFFGPQEMEDLPAGRQAHDLREFYPFLTEVYKNGYVKVYKAP